jgi:hypothetical protein
MLNGLDPIGFSEVEESLLNLLPSYKEVLTHPQLPIFVGGKLLSNPGKKIRKAEGCSGQVSCGWGCGDALIKGAFVG